MYAVTMAIEDAFDLLVEVLDSHRAQLMQDAPRFDTIARVRIGTVLRRHQDPPGRVAAFLDVGCVVVPIAQDETSFKRQFPQQGGGGFMSAAFAGVRSAATGSRPPRQSPPGATSSRNTNHASRIRSSGLRCQSMYAVRHLCPGLFCARPRRWLIESYCRRRQPAHTPPKVGSTLPSTQTAIQPRSGPAIWPAWLSGGVPVRRIGIALVP